MAISRGPFVIAVIVMVPLLSVARPGDRDGDHKIELKDGDHVLFSATR